MFMLVEVLSALTVCSCKIQIQPDLLFSLHSYIHFCFLKQILTCSMDTFN
jgi:hypothetical protein